MSKPFPWTIEALVSALSCPKQQAPELARSFHPLAPTEHNYTIGCQWINFTLMGNGEKWRLTIPLGGTFERSEREIVARCRTTQHLTRFAEARYIRSAVVVFDSEGTPHTLPALLQRHSEPLDEFIRLNCSIKHRTCLRRALESTALTAKRLLSEGLNDYHISRRSIGFDKECRLVLSDYPIVTGGGSAVHQLCSAALFLYIAGCQMDAYKLLSERSKTTAESQRRLRAILATGEHYAIRPLVRIVESLLHEGSVEELATLLGDIAAEPFRPLPLLTGLLSDTTSQPTTPDIVNSQDITPLPMVDFALCEEVLPAGIEGVVRYRLRGLWGYAHTNGDRLLVERILLFADEFLAGRAVIKTPRGYGLINTEGRVVMNDVWEDLCWHPRENVVTAADNLGKWHIYDSCGRQLSSVACDWMGCVSEGFVVARKGRKFGYYSTSGQKLTDFIYDEAFGFAGDVALVCFKGSYYHIDTTFHRLAPHEEEFIQRYRGLKES